MKCSVCGKFRKQADLVYKFEPDTSFTHEDSWFECKKCKLEDFIQLEKIKEELRNEPK